MKKIVNDIKIGLKMMKYALSRKGNSAIFIILLAIGIVSEIFSKGQNIYGALWFPCSAMFASQMIISVDVSTMVQTSVYKKRLQTSIPVLVECALTLFLYTVLVGMKIIFCTLQPQQESIIFGKLLYMSFFVLIIGIYAGFVYKYFVLGVFFVIFAMLFSSGHYFVATLVYNQIMIPSWIIVIIGYASILISSIIQYALTCATYRQEISNRAFGPSLQRAAQ